MFLVELVTGLKKAPEAERFLLEEGVAWYSTGEVYQTGGCHGRSAALAFCSQSECLPYISSFLFFTYQKKTCNWVYVEKTY